MPISRSLPRCAARRGNRPTDEIEKLIRARAPTIRSFIEDEWAACLEVY